MIDRREVELVRHLLRAGHPVSRKALSESIGVPDLEGLLESLEQAETADELWRLLDALSPEQRAVTVLHYYADLKHAEIARRLDLPAATIRWRLHAALKQLRRLWNLSAGYSQPTNHFFKGVPNEREQTLDPTRRNP